MALIQNKNQYRQCNSFEEKKPVLQLINAIDMVRLCTNIIHNLGYLMTRFTLFVRPSVKFWVFFFGFFHLFYHCSVIHPIMNSHKKLSHFRLAWIEECTCT